MDQRWKKSMSISHAAIEFITRFCRIDVEKKAINATVLCESSSFFGVIK